MHIFGLFLVVALVTAFSSCKPSRVWATKEKNQSTRQDDVYEDRRNDDHDDRGRYETTPPPSSIRQYYVSTPLILNPSPGFVMNRYPDGRFYHRSRNGFLYWKSSFDNRFYLDRSYIHRVRYDRYEYDQWREFYRSGERRYWFFASGWWVRVTYMRDSWHITRSFFICIPEFSTCFVQIAVLHKSSL